MTWEYRLVKYSFSNSTIYKNKELLQIEEVYYNENNEIVAFGEAPVPYGENIEEVRECLNLMCKALEKDVIDKIDIENNKIKKESDGND